MPDESDWNKEQLKPLSMFDLAKSWPRLSEQLPANDKWRSAGGWWLGIADGRLRRRKGVARPELQPTIGGGKFQAAAANGDGWK
jgi:hypothetical protein